MDLEVRLTAEAIGRAAYREGMSLEQVEIHARRRYNSVLLQDCVVAGWNMERQRT